MIDSAGLQQTHVHIQQTPSNGLGTGGFVLSIVGLFSCGLLCPIGAIMSLVALKREPKGLAIAGLIIGLIGSMITLVLLLFFGGFIATVLATVGLGATVVAEQAQRKQGSFEAASAICVYYEQEQALPDTAVGSDLIAGFTYEGSAFRYQPGMTDDFILSHPGDDGVWDTDDDWLVTWTVGDWLMEQSLNLDVDSTKSNGL